MATAEKTLPTGEATNQKTTGVRRVEQALEHIEQGIRDGKYLPGHRLVEAELAKNSGLNIGPIREALRVLAGEGLIEIRPYRGATVTRLSVEQIEKVYQAAKGVVYMSLRLGASECPKPENKRKLRAAMADIKSAQDDRLTDFLASLANYYFTLHEIVDNPYFSILIKRLHLGLVHREVANLHPGLDRGTIVKAYAGTTKALIAGDFETALEFQFRHLDNYVELVRKSGKDAVQYEE